MSASLRTISDAIYAVREAMEDTKPTTEAEAIEAASEALDNLIDTALIYTSDILAYWDGSTHPEIHVDRDNGIDLMALVTQSVAYDLRQQWESAIFDGIDGYIDAHLIHPNRDDLDRDDALEIINGDGPVCEGCEVIVSPEQAMLSIAAEKIILCENCSTD